MSAASSYVPGHLLVVDPALLDLAAVRAAADRRGWDVELQRLDGSPAPVVPPERETWFAELLRLRITARDGADVPDAAVLVRSSPGLALDRVHRRPDPW